MASKTTEPRFPNNVISLEKLAKHNKKTDCWIAIHGRVFDVTKFLSQHPGGSEIILAVAGKVCMMSPSANSL